MPILCLHPHKSWLRVIVQARQVGSIARMSSCSLHMLHLSPELDHLSKSGGNPNGDNDGDRKQAGNALAYKSCYWGIARSSYHLLILISSLLSYS